MDSGQVLPIDEHEKVKLLPIKSVRLRVRMVAHWIDQLNSTWRRFVPRDPVDLAEVRREE